VYNIVFSHTKRTLTFAKVMYLWWQ